MPLVLYCETSTAPRLYSQFKVFRLGKMMNRGIKSSPEGNFVDSLINLTDEREFPSLPDSIIDSKQDKRWYRTDFHIPSKQKSEQVQKISPLQLEASASANTKNDTSIGKSGSSSPRNYKLCQTDQDHREKNPSFKSPERHDTYHVFNQSDTELPTSFGKSRSASPRNRKFRQTNNEYRGKNVASGNTKLQDTYNKCQEAKRSSKSSFGTPVGDPFDICLPEIGESNSEISTNKGKTSKWVEKIQSSKDNQKNINDMEKNNNNIEESVEGTSEILRPGMLLFKHYLSLSEQVDFVNRCRELGLGPGGFYRPGYDDGAKLRLYMMCLGLDWNPQTRRYGDIRHHDNAVPPVIPQDFSSLVCRVLDDSHTLIKRKLKTTNVEYELPLMFPDLCIVNFYNTNGRLGLHQDRDESKKSLSNRLPVVSISLGDSAEFLYGDDRDVDKAGHVLLESGDVLIFGGDSRHIFHGVKTIIPNTAPPALLKLTKLRPGRLNLTFRKY